MRAFVTTADRALAARWRRNLEELGAEVSVCDELKALKSAARKAGAALSLIDCGMLAPAPGRELKLLAARLPELRVLVFGDEAALYGPEFAEVMSSGAVDFLAVSETDATLRLRIKSHLGAALGAGVLTAPGGSLRVVRGSREVAVRAGKTRWRLIANLTPKEFDLLCVFLEHPGIALLRDGLMERLWSERSGSVNSEVIDKHVGSLRKKLGREGGLIRTVRGVGYELSAD